MKQLEEKIRSKQAKVAIIGLGYVGLPLAVGFAQKGFEVVGVDTDQRRIQQIQRGRSYILDVPREELAALRRARRLRATMSSAVLGRQDAIIICVPTPLRKTREPDMSFILAATKDIARHARRGQLRPHRRGSRGIRPEHAARLPATSAVDGSPCGGCRCR